MNSPETHSLVSTEDERSRNQTHRSSTALLPIQGSQQTPPSEPEPPAGEMTTMKEAKPKPLQRPQSAWSLWWIEIFNCLLMIGMLCTIVGVLYPNNGKPLPDLPYHVSINTIVSILSTTLKASAALILAEGISHLKWNSFQQYRLLNGLAVFDKASRGPLGCLQLLTALVRRGWQFAPLLAAALTILTLALDPFTQQLVRYYDCRQENIYQKAGLPRANTYNEGGRSATIAASVVGVINQGLYNPDPVTAPLFCPSGNCTFDPPFTTLGFCSICEDISSQLVISKESETSTVSTHQNSSWVKTTIPSGSYSSYDAPTGGTWFSMNSYLNDGTNNASNWVDIIQASLAFPGEPKPRWFHNTSECGTALNNGTWACSGIGGSGAARCKIKPCVRTYKATLEHGHFKEELVRSYLNMAFVTSYNATLGKFWSAADLRCAGFRAVERLRNEGIYINNTDDIIPWNVLVNNL
ncbi:hypothetical protein PG991_009518 [Apiospora marii]|uniref:Uncharacterized protein n=1 Tax=Apiospora marii TaxID=335849 RepID=A0ABR1RJ11_9PEZI